MIVVDDDHVYHPSTRTPAWLHSRQLSVAGRQTPDTEEEETLSMGSSGSFQDQGYAASEGMAEDSGLVSSPLASDTTHPTSPDGSLSLDSSGSSHPMIHPLTKDCSSDSDEGCATWGSRHRYSNCIATHLLCSLRYHGNVQGAHLALLFNDSFLVILPVCTYYY